MENEDENPLRYPMEVLNSLPNESTVPEHIFSLKRGFNAIPLFNLDIKMGMCMGQGTLWKAWETRFGSFEFRLEYLMCQTDFTENQMLTWRKLIYCTRFQASAISDSWVFCDRDEPRSMTAILEKSLELTSMKSALALVSCMWRCREQLFR